MTDKHTAIAMADGWPRIFFVRGQKVMLDEDLATLYKFEIEALSLAVERNIECFTEEFAFQLNPDELISLKSQLANSGREAPYVFTGQGLALLSGIMFDEWADQENHECAPTCSCRS